jgi:hypothetical protein
MLRSVQRWPGFPDDPVEVDWRRQGELEVHRQKLTRELTELRSQHAAIKVDARGEWIGWW